MIAAWGARLAAPSACLRAPSVQQRRPFPRAPAGAGASGRAFGLGPLLRRPARRTGAVAAQQQQQGLSRSASAELVSSDMGRRGPA